MGLRTASVRRLHVSVMAPALTDSSQPTNFKLVPPEETDLVELASPIKQFPKCEQQQQHSLSTKIKHLPDSSGASDNTLPTKQTCIMSSQLPMADEQKMGLQKATSGLDDAMMHKTTKPTSNNDVDQLFAVCPNVDDFLQVFKSMENNDRTTSNDNLDAVFPAVGDLTSLEKELLDDVGSIMNISIDNELESVSNLKESQAEKLSSELKKRNAKLRRQLDFLRRRVAKLQGKYMGQHISDEITGVYEYVHQTLKRTDPSDPSELSRPMSDTTAKVLARKLEATTLLQANAIGRQKTAATRYFGSGSLESPPTFQRSMNGSINIPPWPTEHKNELAKVSGMLKTELCIVQKEIDSEATESSSGGESCDEMQTYNNNHQQYLSIKKRALWKFSNERAAIAARWTWLQSQISDLEFRIRQHGDLYKRVRTRKGSIKLEGPSPPPISNNISGNTVNGYRGPLPGSAPTKPLEGVSLEAAATTANGSSCPDYQCARTRALVHVRKRKLLQVAGLHAVSKKANRPSTVRCGCAPPGVPSCALCTGRTDPTYPRDPPETMSRAERVALIDPGFHPVFSLPEDTSQTVHFDAIMKTTDWQQRTARMKWTKLANSKTERVDKTLMEHRTKKLDHRKKYGRLLKPSTITALTTKIKNRNRKAARHSMNRLNRRRQNSKMSMSHQGLSADEEVEDTIANSSGLRSLNSPNSSPLLMQSITGYNRRNRVDSYDIDNIIIPYSVAASTRVEKLQYKEILTPKWRIAEPDSKYESKNNGIVKGTSQESDVEDLSEEAVIARHDRCEYDERKKFLSYVRPSNYGRPRSNKRTDSRAESSGANTPDPMSPHPTDHQDSPITSPPATPLSIHNDESQPMPAIMSTSTGNLAVLPSVSALRRRTISQSRFGMMVREDSLLNLPETIEVAPFERRVFPLTDEAYSSMMQNMPEHHQFKTNVRAQDSNLIDDDYLDQKVDSPGSESTESALGDEDPNDPEWIEMDTLPRDRHKR